MRATFGKLTQYVLASLVALAVSMPVAAQAEPKNLFDFLFGGQHRRLNRNDLPPEPKPQVVRRKKIRAPSFFTYKPDPLVKVGFSATLAALKEQLEPAPQPAVTPTDTPNKFEAQDDDKLSTGAISAPERSPSPFLKSMDVIEAIELKTTKEIAKALDNYYATNPDFLWVTGDFVNQRARAALEVLGSASVYGLKAADYAVAMPSSTFSLDDMEARRAELMRFEMALSARLLRYVSDAGRGRINPNRLSGYHDLPVLPLDLEKVLAEVATAEDIAAIVESYHPKSTQYKSLKDELAELRASEEKAIVINDLKLLKPGQSHPEFPEVLQIIRKNSPEAVQVEFGELLIANAGSETYSQELVPLIKAAQKAAGTKPDGIIGRNTIKSFFGESKQSKIDRVVLAMERLRWLPHELGKRRVFVNQPAFMVDYVEGDQPKLSMRVVVGKRSNQTSFFYDEIEQIDYNPYWGVPQSILVNEMLPKLINDPSYLDRTGYEVSDARGRRISSSAVNWGQYAGRIPFNVRQTPGRSNALGELKILFPNKHAIYMHDTPAKKLFSRDARAFSHGCIRLHDPRAMAAAVLGKPQSYVAQKIGQGHSSEKVPGRIPVYVSYFTAWPRPDGSIGYYHDVYGRDAHLLKSIAIVDDLRETNS